MLTRPLLAAATAAGTLAFIGALTAQPATAVQSAGQAPAAVSEPTPPAYEFDEDD